MLCSNGAIWFSGIGQIGIGLAVAYIAWRQHCVSKEQFRLSLYDKRFAVWASLRELFDEIGRDGSVDVKSIVKFRIQTREALFLFESGGIADYLKEISDKAAELRASNRRIAAHTPPNGETFEQLVERNDGLVRWFIQQMDEVSVNLFSRYLRFK